MSPREQHIFQNEELFREVNSHIAALDDRLGVDGKPLLLMCECANTGCTTLIRVEPATFREVRASSGRFLVAPGHERLDTEAVVGQAVAYLVVEKHDEAGAESGAG